MRKTFIAILTLMSIAVPTVSAFANSVCRERRDACYAVIEPALRKSAGHKCKAEFGRCIRAFSSAQEHFFVPTIPGLGSPMVQPYPTAAVPVSAGTAISNAAALSAEPRGNVRAIGNLVKISPSMAASGTITGPALNGPPSSSGAMSISGGTSTTTAAPTQGSSATQVGPSSGGGSSNGSLGHARAN